MNLNLPILQKEQGSLPHFINYWSDLYFYPTEDLYNNNINKESLTIADLYELFEWKNGMPLSQQKFDSIDNNIAPKIELINELKAQNKIDVDEFLNEFGHLTSVWKIFLLHIVKPQKYPIYDQHIHRCFYYMKSLDYKQIKSTISDKKKDDFYFNTYLPFIKELNGISLRKIDQAFFTFGRLLHTHNYDSLFK